jgi:lipoteichoic acid synthase
MPTLTRLTREGIVFDHAYAVYPESIKGLYAMLCSFAPAPHTSAAAYDAGALPCRSIAQSMKDDGYATGLFHSGRFAYLGMDHVVNRRGYDALVDAKTIGGKHSSSFGTDDMSTVRAVLARFDARRTDERLFVTYMPISGHHPYESPGEGPRPFGERTDFERYESDLFRGDLALAALVDGLSARGLYEDTLFVIHGDHGEAFQQHEGNFAHTLCAYDENLHVPLVIVAPGIVRGGLRARQLVSLLDIAPTIADLVGTHADVRWQGVSALRPEARVVRSFADHTSVKLALRTGRHKLVYDADTGGAALFDLVADPGEQDDVALQHRALTSAYRADLEHWAAAQRSAVAGTVRTASAR